MRAGIQIEVEEAFHRRDLATQEVGRPETFEFAGMADRVIGHLVSLARQLDPVGQALSAVFFGQEKCGLEPKGVEVGGRIVELAVQAVVVGQAHRRMRTFGPIAAVAPRHGGGRLANQGDAQAAEPHEQSASAVAMSGSQHMTST